MVYTVRFFFSLKCSLFQNSNLLGSYIIHILYTECAKIKKNNSGAKRLWNTSGCQILKINDSILLCRWFFGFCSLVDEQCYITVPDGNCRQRNVWLNGISWGRFGLIAEKLNRNLARYLICSFFYAARVLITVSSVLTKERARVRTTVTSEHHETVGLNELFLFRFMVPCITYHY